MEENRINNLIINSQDIDLDHLKDTIKEKYLQRKIKKTFPLKFSIALLTPFVAVSVVVFALIPLLNKPSGSIFDDLPVYESLSGDIDTIENAHSDSLFAFSAITSVGMLDAPKENTPNYLFKNKGDGPKDELNPEIIEEIRGYLSTAEAALLGETVLSSSHYVESDREDYSIKLVVTYTDLSLKQCEMVMYYNEIVSEEDDPADVEPPYDEDKPPHDDEPPHDGDKPPLDDEPPHDGDEPPHDDNPPHDEDEPPLDGHGHRPGDYDKDEKYEFTMTGILIHDGVEFPMEGGREVDDDEMEIYFRYYLNENEYVAVKQEIEEDEIEFDYTLFYENRPLNSYSLELKNNHVLELEYRSLNMQECISLLFFLYQDEEKGTYIVCEYQKEMERYHIIFHKNENGEYEVVEHQRKNERD